MIENFFEVTCSYACVMQSAGFGISKESALPQTGRNCAPLLPVGLGAGLLLGSTEHLSSNTCFDQLEQLKISSFLPVPWNIGGFDQSFGSCLLKTRGTPLLSWQNGLWFSELFSPSISN